MVVVVVMRACACACVRACVRVRNTRAYVCARADRASASTCVCVCAGAGSCCFFVRADLDHSQIMLLAPAQLHACARLFCFPCSSSCVARRRRRRCRSWSSLSSCSLRFDQVPLRLLPRAVLAHRHGRHDAAAAAGVPVLAGERAGRAHPRAIARPQRGHARLGVVRQPVSARVPE